MSDAEHDFIFGQLVDRNIDKVRFAISRADFYDAEKALSELKKLHRNHEMDIPEDLSQLALNVAKLGVPALTAQAQDLFEKKEYGLVLATLQYLTDFCKEHELSLPEEAEDLASDLAEHKDELPKIPQEYQGDQIIAFFKMQDGLCQYGLYFSPARFYSVLKNHDGKYIGAFADVNLEFIERAIIRTRYFTYHDVDRIELSDILEEE